MNFGNPQFTDNMEKQNVDNLENDEKYIKSLKNQHLLLTWSVFLL